MMSEKEQEVGKIVVVIPAAVTVFERFGVRFYDSAPQTLEAACQSAQAPLDDVLKALREASHQKDGKHGRWDNVPLVALIRYVLENHHEWERVQVGKIQKQVDQAAAADKDGRTRWEALQGRFRVMTKRFLAHMKTEERDLFPPFLHEVSPGAGQAVRVAAAKRLTPLTHILEKEHDDLLAEWEQMKSLSNGFQVTDDISREKQEVLAGLAGLERYQHQHIHKENFILFEKIRTMSS